MSNELAANQSYALGHTQGELKRLIEQSQTLDDLTEQVLKLAGVGPGMRVLDVGCGAGDVSFLAARIVGPDGHVVGVDRSADAIQAATRRAAEAGLNNVEFRVADLSELTLEEPVDALIGRLILMYFPDPAVVLRRLKPLVRAGGIVAFQELDVRGAQTLPPVELFETSVQRIADTFVRTGADISAGLKLGRIFQEAGLPSPRMMMSAQVECGPDFAFPDQIVGLTRSLLPIMERTGIATAADVEVETLGARLREAMRAAGATVVSPSYFGAWSRTVDAVSQAN
jgi:2-polyprenyl-3-methyl-5-hydroxy-6-metoxy-1,4-benzoquinol methylase